MSNPKYRSDRAETFTSGVGARRELRVTAVIQNQNLKGKP